MLTRSLRFGVAFVAIVASALALSATAAAYPNPANRQQTTMHLGANVSHDTYLKYKVTLNWQNRYPVYTWSHDGCSAPWWTPTTRQRTVFHRACIQHDFCYRNGRRFWAWSTWLSAVRPRCDSRFLTEMYRLCDRQRNNGSLPPSHPVTISAWRTCRGDAEQFYSAVRRFGS